MNDKQQMEIASILDEWYLACKDEFNHILFITQAEEKTYPLGMRKEDLKKQLCEWVEKQKFLKGDEEIIQRVKK